MLRMFIIGTLAIGFALAQASVPKGATEIEPGVFKHTDAAGKTFLYRKTPFGVVKSAESKSADTKTAEPVQPKADVSREAAKPAGSTTASPFGNVKQNSKAQDVRVVEKGEVLEFERSSPFGQYRWSKKKSELTDEERGFWTRSQSERASNEAAGSKE